jgi:sugar phosphate permease
LWQDLSDKIFGSRRMPVLIIYLVLLAVVILSGQIAGDGVDARQFSCS